MPEDNMPASKHSISIKVLTELFITAGVLTEDNFNKENNSLHCVKYRHMYQ
jgi:hypothetical protein